MRRELSSWSACPLASRIALAIEGHSSTRGMDSLSSFAFLQRRTSRDLHYQSQAETCETIPPPCPSFSTKHTSPFSPSQNALIISINSHKLKLCSLLGLTVFATFQYLFYRQTNATIISAIRQHTCHQYVYIAYRRLKHAASEHGLDTASKHTNRKHRSTHRTQASDCFTRSCLQVLPHPPPQPLIRICIQLYWI